MNVPHFCQRTNDIPSSITMNSGLDYANMYHNGMKSILQNATTLFPQRYVIDDVVVTNQSNQNVEGCVPQEQWHPLTPNIVAGNDNVQDRIVTIELIIFHRM